MIVLKAVNIFAVCSVFNEHCSYTGARVLFLVLYFRQLLFAAVTHTSLCVNKDHIFRLSSLWTQAREVGKACRDVGRRKFQRRHNKFSGRISLFG